MKEIDQGGEDNHYNTSGTRGTSVRPKTSLKTTSIQLRPAVRVSTQSTTGTTSSIKSVRKYAADGKDATAAGVTTSAPKPRPRKPAFNGRTQGSRFGLVQWQRLVRSSPDLAQRKGAPLRKNIPWEEIRKHNQPHDCWMVLRGVVYNIGPYLAYHPGGKEIFSKLKLLGADGTEAYDKYHPWVSIEGLIGTLAIGTVLSDPGAEPSDDDDVLDVVHEENSLESDSS